MFIIFAFLIFGLRASLGDDRSCDHLGVLFYEEMGCVPQKDASSGCPVSYDCSGYKRSEKNCNYLGQKYNAGEEVNANVTGPNCQTSCFCLGGIEGFNKAQLHCAQIECPEHFGSIRPRPNCYRKYDLDSCCSVSESCEPVETVEKCEVEGNTYKEGEKFYPENKCLACVCQKGFEGKFEEPFCKKLSCGFEINHSEELEKNCAPVYYDIGDKKSLCCPYSWLCSDEKDVTLESEGKESDKKCNFGSKQFNIGDVFRKNSTEFNNSGEVKCSCDVPPYLTCKGR